MPMLSANCSLLRSGAALGPNHLLQRPESVSVARGGRALVIAWNGRALEVPGLAVERER
jgi:hypothetical protein